MPDPVHSGDVYHQQQFGLPRNACKYSGQAFPMRTQGLHAGEERLNIRFARRLISPAN
jgi:hypothetical protein